MNRKVLLGLLSTSALLAACSHTCKVDGGKIKPGSAEDFAANVPNTVYFDFNKSNLSDAARKRIDAQACWLKTYTGTKVTVAGHTDIRGTAEYNQALSNARANSTATELSNNGVGKDRITTVGFGKERVVDTGTSEISHAKNRRTETTVD